MKRSFFFFPGLLLFILGANANAQVDSLSFISGDYILGEVKSMQKSVLVMETKYSDSDFSIDWDKITGIYTKTHFRVHLSDGSRYYGRLQSISDKDILILTSANDSIATTNANIVYLKPYNDKFLDRLSANISLGFNMAQARNLRQLTIRSQVGYQAEKWSTDVSFYNLNSTQDETQDIKRTESDLNFRYLLPYRFYGIATVSYLSNTEQKLDMRMNAQMGAGNYLVQNNSMYWGAKLGVNRNLENYSSDAEDRQSWEGYFGTELNVFDMGDLDLLLLIMAYPGLTDLGRWRTDSKFDIKYDLPYDFFVKLGISFNYDNQPAEGASETDYVFNVGFGWEW